MILYGFLVLALSLQRCSWRIKSNSVTWISQIHQVVSSLHFHCKVRKRNHCFDGDTLTSLYCVYMSFKLNIEHIWKHFPSLSFFSTWTLYAMLPFIPNPEKKLKRRSGIVGIFMLWWRRVTQSISSICENKPWNYNSANEWTNLILVLPSSLQHDQLELVQDQELLWTQEMPCQELGF